MSSIFSKRTITAAVLVVLAVGIFAFFKIENKSQETASEPKNVGPVRTVIGQSLEGRSIEADTFGSGQTHLLFVGGIHGGYEWNSVLLAYQLLDYLRGNPEIVPDNLTVTIIPSANPDGVFKVVGKEGLFTLADVTTDKEVLASGRFNAGRVDLNRNFDCKWQATSTWQSKTVSGGSAAFSEPEAKAIRDYVVKNNISAAVFWHSQSNAVYASQCENGVLPITLDIMNAYSASSSYPAVKTFDAYTTTGAADDWLSSIGIPAITVELSTHNTIEWNRNLAGIRALFTYFAAK